MEEIRTKVLAKHGLATDPDAMNAVDMETGEISEEKVEAPAKKTKKSKKLQ